MLSVGRAVRLNTLSRWHHPGMEEESIRRSLENLGLDYVDLVSNPGPQIGCSALLTPGSG